MRRILALVALAATSLAAPSASAAPEVIQTYEVEANWFFATDNPKVLTWYTAHAWGDASTGIEEFAHIAKGRCRVKKNGYGQYLACAAPEIAYAEDEDVLTVGPGLQTASLELTARDGSLHSVAWEAEVAAPGFYQLTQNCDENQSIMFTRSAVATGDIDGRDVEGPASWEGLDITSIGRGVGVDNCSSDRRMSDGIVHAVFDIGR